MNRWGPWIETNLGKVVTVAVVLAAAVAIGGPLFGSGSFLGTDGMLRAFPWNQLPERPMPTGSVPFNDTWDFRMPNIIEIRERLWAGDLAEWSDRGGGGHSLLARQHDGLLNPVAWPLLILPLQWAPAVVKALEIGVGVLGFRKLAVHLNWQPTAGVVAGFAFALSGVPTLATNWPHAHMVALIPWVFVFVFRYLETPGLRTFGVLSLMQAVMFGAGFPAFVAYTAYTALGVIFLVRLADNGPSIRSAAIAVRDCVAFVWASVLGLLLLAPIYIPFYFELSESGLFEFRRKTESNLGLINTAQILFPFAWGNPETSRYYGPANVAETSAFIGSGMVLLALLYLLGVRKGKAGIKASIALGLLTWSLAIYVPGPWFDLANSLPGIANSSIGRARIMVLFLLALGAAGGVDALLTDGIRLARTQLAALCLAGVVFAAVALRVVSGALGEGEVGAVLPTLALTCASALAVLVWWAVAQWRGAPSSILAVLALLLIVVDLAVFGRIIFPQREDDAFYPVTPSHEFLLEAQGDDRIAFHRSVHIPGVTEAYGLRNIAGHHFHPPTWNEALTVLDPETNALRTTQPTFDILEPGRIDSGVLDRMGVKLAVYPATIPLYSVLPTQGRATLHVHQDRIRLDLFDPIEMSGLILSPSQLGIDNSEERFYRAVAIGESGEVVGTGAQWMWEGIGDFQMALPTSAAAVAVEVFVPSSREPDRSEIELTLLTPDQTDTIDLVFGEGVQVYRRSTSLPVVRSAVAPVVVESKEERLKALGEPGVADSFIASESLGALEDPVPLLRVLSVDQRDPDRVIVSVQESDTRGWIVVSSAMQRDWIATVDGERQPLVHADHFGVAVSLPPGTSELRLERHSSQVWWLLAGGVLVVVMACIMLGRRRFEAMD